MTAALLDVLTAQPSYGSALRRLICELAIAGRLLPQTSTWAEQRLSEIVSVRGGSTPSMARPEYWGGDVPWVSPKDMHVGDIVTSEMFVTKEALAKTNLELVPLGSVLIVGRSGILKRKLPAQITRVPCTVNQDIKALTPKSAIESAYLRLWLLGSERAILAEDVKTGTTVQSLVFAKLFARPVKLPPTDEQKRIVAKVDELMALCDRLEAEQANAEAAHAKLVDALLASLTQARDAADFRASWQQLAEHFHTLFTTEASVDALARAVHDLALRGVLEPQQSAISATLDPGEPIALRSRKSKLPPLTTSEIPFAAPPGWTWQRLEAITSVLTDGEHLTPPRTNDSQQVPLATAKNVRDGFIDLDQTDYVERPVAEKCWKRCKPSRGDVLMVSVGATLGRVAVMADDREMVIVRSVALFRPVQVVPDFLAMALRSGLLQSQIWARVRQSAQPCLYLSQAAQLAVPVPPLEEQQRIVEKVAALLGLCDQLKQHLANARKHHDHLASVLVEQAVA